MKERIQSGLQFFCTNKDNYSIGQILDKYKTKDYIDVLYNDGTYFHTAIAHNNPELISMLLNYMYDTKQINTDPKDNITEQSTRYEQLKQVLKIAKKEYVVSEEIDSIISSFYKESNYDNDSYIDYDNLSTHDQEYHELDLAGNSKILEDNEF
jgi:hypothetical protein